MWPQLGGCDLCEVKSVGRCISVSEIPRRPENPFNGVSCKEKTSSILFEPSMPLRITLVVSLKRQSWLDFAILIDGIFLNL